MGIHQVGFKPEPDLTLSAGSTIRMYTTQAVDLTALGNTIPTRHMVVANQRISRMGFFVRAASSETPGTVTMAAYVADADTNAPGARVGAKQTITCSSVTPAWCYVDCDIDLTPFIGQYIKPGGGSSIGLRPYYSEGTLGDSASRDADCPDPFGAVVNRSGVYGMYMEIEDVDVGPRITPTGTDKSIAVGATHSTAFQNLASPPVSVAIVRGETVTAQADFVYTPDAEDETQGTATFTGTLGNLPHGTSGYSYLVTCADESEITFDIDSLSPQEDSTYTVLVEPLVIGEQSILENYTGDAPTTGMQIRYPLLTDQGGDLTVYPDTSHGVTYPGETPSSDSFNAELWDLEKWRSFSYFVDLGGAEPTIPEDSTVTLKVRFINGKYSVDSTDPDGVGE